MQIYINHNSSKVNARLYRYIEKQIQEMEVLMDSPSSVRVNIGRENINFYCEIILHEKYSKHGSTLKTKSKAKNPSVAIKNTLHSIKNQLKKRHNRTKERPLGSHIINFTQHKINKTFNMEDINDESFEYNLEEKEDMPIKKCNIKEALMFMELEDSTCYVFINSDNNKVNIIQRTEQGQLNIIDTKSEAMN